MKVTRRFTKNQIAGLLASAMEGGVGYWAELTKYGKPKKVWMWDAFEDGQIFPHIQYPLSLGGSITLRDMETQKSYTLTLEKIHKGLQIMSDKYPWHFQNFVTENYDAETGDVFVQCALLGEAVYG